MTVKADPGIVKETTSLHVPVGTVADIISFSLSLSTYSQNPIFCHYVLSGISCRGHAMDVFSWKVYQYQLQLFEKMEELKKKPENVSVLTAAQVPEEEVRTMPRSQLGEA